MKGLFYIILFVFTVLFYIPKAVAQDTAKSKTTFVEQKIKNKEFTFVANWVIPMAGTSRQLTDYYTVRLHKDSIMSDLPYFGQSYTAPMDPTKIGISLNDAVSKYAVVKKKKARWDILIQPANQLEVQSFSLTVYDDGTAYLDVICSNRNPISYRGFIEEKN